MFNIKKQIKERVLNECNYILKTGDTIRKTAKFFNVSKSTTHKDITERLNLIDKKSYKKIVKIMNKHIAVRHINGGQSTKQKYLLLNR